MTDYEFIVNIVSRSFHSGQQSMHEESNGFVRSHFTIDELAIQLLDGILTKHRLEMIRENLVVPSYWKWTYHPLRSGGLDLGPVECEVLATTVEAARIAICSRLEQDDPLSDYIMTNEPDYNLTAGDKPLIM